MADPNQPMSAGRNSDPSPQRSYLWLGLAAVVVVAVALFAWSSIAQDDTSNSNVVDGETLDVDTVTETADVPEEDANPNPVVPQDALIPPTPVDDAPPD